MKEVLQGRLKGFYKYFREWRLLRQIVGPYGEEEGSGHAIAWSQQIIESSVSAQVLTRMFACVWLFGRGFTLVSGYQV